MKTVNLEYWVMFGKCDGSDRLDWSVELTDEEEKIYNQAVADELDLNEVPELQGVLDRAYRELVDIETQNAIDSGDEDVREAMGEYEVDPDEINELVYDRDPHTLAFFGLENATDEEFEKWDANNLDKLPLAKDFIEDFEPESPFDHGWDLSVVFIEPDEDEDE